MKKQIIILFLIMIPIYNISSQWIIRNSISTNPLYAVRFFDMQTGLIGGDNAKLYRTTNGGNNWNLLTTPLPQAATVKSISSFGNFWWIIGSRQDTTMMSYIYRTTNNGVSWTQQMAASLHYFYTSFAYDSSICWVAGTYGGTSGAIIKTTNGGTNWTTQVGGQYGVIKCLYFLNIMTGWAAGNNTMLVTTNSGTNWSFYNITELINSLYFTNALTGWAGTDNGRLLKTTNGGVTFFTYLSGLANTSLNSVQFPMNGTTGYCANSSLIFKSTNSGNNWLPMETTVPSDIEAMHCLTANNCYAVTFDGSVVYSTNGGGNYNINSITVRRNNLNKQITMNNTTYDTITINIPSPTATIIDVNAMIDTVINSVDSNLIFILSHQGISDTIIYRVGGAGNNFIRTVLNDSATIPISAGIPPFTGSFKPSRPLSKFNFVPINGQWILKIKETQSVERTGVIKSWGINVTYNFQTAIKKISEKIPAKFELMQNYPNPFNPKTNIKYSVSQNQNIKLIVYDILGKEMETLVNDNHSPGVYEVSFDGDRLSSGVYFYKLIAGEFYETKKMILIK